MKSALARWKGAGYHLNLDWLLRCVNTVATGEAKFHHLHEIEPAQFEDGLSRAEKCIDHLLNTIASRLGLDHDRVFFGRYALPTLVHYVNKRGGTISNAVERDRMLFWFLHSAMWGRYSGSTETFIDKDLKLLEDVDGGLDRLIDELRVWHGGLRVQPAHFKGWSLGARFYPVLYLLTRTESARDWDSGIELKRGLLGNMSRLEVHHIFPRAVLYKSSSPYRRADVNAVANFCFLTKDANLKISASRPEKYFPEVEAKHPGALASQWIPMDEKLWKVENYLDFLEARRALLADVTNRLLQELFHDQLPEDREVATAAQPVEIPGGIDSEEEEAELEALNEWVAAQGLPSGESPFELADVGTGAPIAILDLAWPVGLQEGFSGPVCLLLNEPKETLEAANARGFRCFTTTAEFRRYVEREVLGGGEETAA